MSFRVRAENTSSTNVGAQSRHPKVIFSPNLRGAIHHRSQRLRLIDRTWSRSEVICGFGRFGFAHRNGRQRRLPLPDQNPTRSADGGSHGMVQGSVKHAAASRRRSLSSQPPVCSPRGILIAERPYSVNDPRYELDYPCFRVGARYRETPALRIPAAECFVRRHPSRSPTRTRRTSGI